MNTLVVNTVPTPDLNVNWIRIDLADFDAHEGVSFICTFYNLSNTIIDRRIVSMGEAEWQAWGPTNDPQADYNYIIDFCITKLGLKKSENI